MSTQQFPIVFPDPPWEYADRREEHGGAVNQYNLAAFDEMKAWGEQFQAMRPSAGVMLMWVTGPYFELAPQLMRAWGYTPIKPIWYWVKTYPNGQIFRGGGAYTQSNVEFVLLGQASPGCKLMPTNRRSKGGSGVGVPEVICAPDETDYSAIVDEAIAVPHPRDHRGKIVHSKKPRVFYDKAVELFGDIPRVEVFARERFAGWHAIGDQLPGGAPIEAGKVIAPLPPPAIDVAYRRRGAVEQRGLFESLGTEASA